MDDKADKPKRRWPTYLAIAFVSLLVLYPLSMGPAAVLMCRVNNESFTGFVGAVYYPLGLAANGTGTQDWADSYCIWWVEHTHTTYYGSE